MSAIINMVQALLESDQKEMKFITVTGKPEGYGRTLNVREVTPNKEWDYFGTIVKIDSDKHVVMNEKIIGKIEKTPDGYQVSPPLNDFTNDPTPMIVGETPVDAVFKFISYHFNI